MRIVDETFRYFSDVLHVDPGLATPDAVAARSSSRELAGILRLVTAAIVKSEANEILIGAVHTLSVEHQVVLMQVIELVLVDMDAYARDSQTAAAKSEIDNLKRELKRLGTVVSEHQEQLTASEHQVEHLMGENKELSATVRAH